MIALGMKTDSSLTVAGREEFLFELLTLDDRFVLVGRDQYPITVANLEQHANYDDLEAGDEAKLYEADKQAIAQLARMDWLWPVRLIYCPSLE